MKPIESLLKKYDPLEPSPELLTKGVELIRGQRRKIGDAETYRRWRLATAALAILLLGSAVLNVMLWFEDDEHARRPDGGVGRPIYVTSNVLRLEQGHFVREIRYEYAPETGEER